jgi:Holliday junction resolvasome RuvABC ATP-dependent DNA helicase subunit
MSIKPSSFIHVIEQKQQEQKDFIKNIKTNFDNNIIGYEAIKRFIILAIKAKMRDSNNKTHILLSGAPSTSKTVFLDNLVAAIGNKYFFMFNGAALSKSGLIDYLAGQNIQEIRYIGIDEIDKVERDQQTILLNALESGKLQETKFKRARTLDVRHILWFATSNDIDKIIDPLKTRFSCINMPPYDDTTLRTIARARLNKIPGYTFNQAITDKIIEECIKGINDVTVRDIVRIASMIEDPKTDIETIIKVYKDHSFPDIER